MNTENSNSNESNKFIYEFTDKLNLKNANKNIALVNLSIYYTWKNNKSYITTINLNSLPQLGMINLNYLMDLILFQAFKIILNTLLKNMRL